MERIDPESLAARLHDLVPMRRLRDQATLQRVAARWCERHRYWHGPDRVKEEG